MNDLVYTPFDEPTSDFLEVRSRKSINAFILGMAIIAAAILAGKSYVFFIPFLVFSFFVTLRWRKVPRPWVFLASIVAATPIAISKEQFACNVVFALWYTIINWKYLFKLPKWIYALIAMAILGIFTSSISWLSSNVIGSLMRQGAYALNFIMAPFVLLPMVYLRMKGSRDHTANLQGLLFCLIVPSTLILISAKLFGSVANAWEASLHTQTSAEGFLQYKLGNVIVNFTRTEVGFILAALICASVAVTISQVKTTYRLVAGACLVSNVFLLLATASFGSAFACICGIAAIFYKQLRSVSVGKVLISVVVICSMLLLTYVLASPSVKKYLDRRFEHRVTDADTDRLTLWGIGVEHFFRNPEGVGFTLSAGEREKTFVHNDYLTYFLSYGLIGGLAYTALVGGLLISFLFRRRITNKDPSAHAVYLAGLGVIVAMALNAITDQLTPNRWYFNAIWSVIWFSYFCSLAAQREKIPEGIGLAIRDHLLMERL